MRNLVGFAFAAFMLSACNSGSGGSVVYDPNTVTQRLENKIIVNGLSAALIPNAQPPSPTLTSDIVTNAPDQSIEAQAGTKATIAISVTSVAALQNLYAKVPGAESYFQAQLASSGKTKASSSRRIALHGPRPSQAKSANPGKSDEATLLFEVDIPSDLQAGGALCFEFSARDSNNAVSDTDVACILVKAASAPPQSDSASACFNPTLYTAGTVVQQRGRESGSFGTFEFDIGFHIVGPVTLNGQNVIQKIYDQDEGGSNYLRAEASVPRVLFFADEEEFEGLTETYSYAPPFELRFDLAPGQSHSGEGVETHSYSDGSPSEQTPFSYTRTYVGRERITVPAGTFDTCRFRFVIEGFDEAYDEWYGVDNGLLLREVIDEGSGSYTFETLSASINGQPVTGN